MTFYIQLFILRLEYGLRIVKFSVFSKLFLYLSTNRLFLQPPPKKAENGNANNFFLIVGSKFVFGEIVALNAVYLALKSWTISRTFSL